MARPLDNLTTPASHGWLGCLSFLALVWWSSCEAYDSTYFWSSMLMARQTCSLYCMLWHLLLVVRMRELHGPRK